MTVKKDDKIHILYFQVTDLWRRLCEEHTDLLDITFEEYSLLLSSKVDELEKLLLNKNKIVERIGHLEQVRSEVIEDLNNYLEKNKQKKVESINELIILMEQFEAKGNQRHLFRFNKLLIDIIEKIQAQNKKNQLFLNRAINNLREIREDALGTKSYSTYNKKGHSRKSSR